ncbi:hypothetical protein QCA50_010569 [Cerrena zonata]|uniref:Uncharacterized protein n=1 Tax=Cerrena zonata TaxID=2478898 RepID=A0AAW0G5E2_9APHY
MEDSLLGLQPPTSPRIRPSGPRTRRRFKSPTPLTLNGGNTSPSDDTPTAYSGRNSPAMSSSRPHSPAPPLTSMPSISQLSEPTFNQSRPSVLLVEKVYRLLHQIYNRLYSLPHEQQRLQLNWSLSRPLSNHRPH